MSDSPHETGHVFVVHGDITKIVVDTWLLPTDRFAQITSAHWGVQGSDRGERRHEFSDAFQSGQAAAEILPWHEPGKPIPVCTSVPDTNVRSAEDIVGPVRQGLRLAAEAAKRRAKPNRGRVAMPTFGTGGGGGSAVRGSFLTTYLQLAAECCIEYGVDVVIVSKSSRSYRGLQILRCREDHSTAWAALDDGKQIAAKRLSRRAAKGSLTPFMGSGVSVTSGLPDWKDLLEQLRQEAALSDVEKAAFDGLNTLDRADLLETVLGAGLKKRIAEATTSVVTGLPPLLLASLKSLEAVTLNYDTLFEQAKEAQGSALTVVPGDDVQADVPWLLKLHGSTKQPDDIVLSRQDYLAYAQSRSALSSLATALLMTKHLLFVGFGFGDDHFHKILHDVRSVYPSSVENETGRRTIGTALVLGHDSVRQRLWSRWVDIISFTDGRTLEIFLDMLVAHSVDDPIYFLRADYDGMLNEQEKKLARDFRELMVQVEHADVHPVVKQAFYRLRRDLGGPRAPVDEVGTVNGATG